MTDNVYKVVQIVGSSSKSTDDAVENAVKKASETIRNLDWFEIVETRGHIENDKVAHYQVKLDIGFRLE